MRFNSTENLVTFRRTGCFPNVHQSFIKFIASECLSDRLCDFGSGLGLLGQELHDRLGKTVLGVDKNARYNAAGRAAGITIPLVDLRVRQSSFAQFGKLLREHRVEGLVCRRSVDVWHEIGDNSLAQGIAAPGTFQEPVWHMTEFAELLRDCGVKEIFIQGDNRPSRWEVEFDVACFAPVYRQRIYQAPVHAYLTVVEAALTAQRRV